MTQWIIIGLVILLFGAVAFRGAPYVPTHRRTVKTALDLLELNHDDVVVDLGSGDGNVLRAAAKRGARAVGYEINPVLFFIAWLRCLPHRLRVRVLLRDFWLAEFPPDATVVFVFLAGPHMRHLSRKLEREMAKRNEPLRVVSYGFAIPGFLPKRIAHGLYLYELQPGSKAHAPLQK
jgi:SAM-dependent methyltransferase